MTAVFEQVFSVASIVVLVAGLVIAVVREAKASAARAGVAAMLFASQIAIVAFLLYAIGFERGSFPSWLYAIVFAISLLCVVATVLLMRGLEGVGRRRLDEARVKALEEQMESVRAYEARLDEARERSRAARARIVALLRDAERKLECDEVDAAISGATEAVDLAQPRIARRCGSVTVDAVLAKKEEACEEHGVRFDARVSLPSDIEWAIPAPVLVALFANSIDNAIAASRQAPPDRRFVEVRSRVEAGWFLLDVANGCSDEPGAPTISGRPFGPRASAGAELVPEHGWGVGIMRDLARRYGGTFSLDLSDGRCRVSLGVPLRRDA